MRVVAVFDPPEAWKQFEEWRHQQAEAFAAVPKDEVRIDVGRTPDGDFVRVHVPDEHANRFPDS